MPDFLNDRLTRLADDIENSAVLAPSATVRSRGDRRHSVAVAAVAGAATLAIAGGAAVAGGAVLTGGDGSPAGMGDAASSRVSAAPTDPALSGVTPQPSHTPPPASPSAGPTGTPSSTPPGGVGPTKIPAGLRMLHEGEAGWRRDDNDRVAAALNPCGGADATLAGRTDARTLTGKGKAGEESHSPSRVTHQLFLYATNAAAAAAYEKLSTEGQSCGWINGRMNPAERSLLPLRKSDESGAGQMDRYWLHDAVVQVHRNALFVAFSDTKGAGMTSNIDDLEFDRMLAPLCRIGLVCR